MPRLRFGSGIQSRPSTLSHVADFCEGSVESSSIDRSSEQMSLVRTRLRRKTRKQRLMAFSLLFTQKKTRLIVLNRHRSIQKGNTFLNQSSSRVRSFYRAHSDHFSRHYFFPFSSISKAYPLLAAKRNFLAYSGRAPTDDFVQQTESIETTPSTSEQARTIPRCVATVC